MHTHLFIDDLLCIFIRVRLQTGSQISALFRIWLKEKVLRGLSANRTCVSQLMNMNKLFGSSYEYSCSVGGLYEELERQKGYSPRAY